MARRGLELEDRVGVNGGMGGRVWLLCRKVDGEKEKGVIGEDGRGDEAQRPRQVCAQPRKKICESRADGRIRGRSVTWEAQKKAQRDYVKV